MICPTASGFDDLAAGENDGALGDAADQGAVVGDEQHGGVPFTLEPAEELDDDGLDRDVEGGG